MPFFSRQIGLSASRTPQKIDYGAKLTGVTVHFANATLVDVPGNADMAAVAMTVGATGAVSLKTTVLMTPEEVDDASEKTVEYRPPGS